MPSIGGWEWLIILVIVVLIFGVGKLGEVGGALGKSLKEFRQAASNPDDDKDKKTSDGDSTTTESKA